jgi:hypothetical protein
LDATLLIEKMGLPLVHAVIPIMDKLTDILEKAANNMELNVVVRAGALAGRNIMNKYYSKTDESVMYRVAMRACFLFTSCLYSPHTVMHPGCKTDYFKKLKWKPGWIELAKDLAREQYDTYYRPTEVEDVAPVVSAAPHAITHH